MISKWLTGKGQTRQLTPIKIGDAQENDGSSLTRSPTRVQFSPKLVSEVHFQEKVNLSERRQLFYSEFEESRWRMDRMREISRAKVLVLIIVYYRNPQDYSFNSSNIVKQVIFCFRHWAWRGQSGWKNAPTKTWSAKSGTEWTLLDHCQAIKTLNECWGLENSDFPRCCCAQKNTIDD